MPTVTSCSCGHDLDGPPRSEPFDDRSVPEMPAWLLEGPPTWSVLDPPDLEAEPTRAAVPEVPAWVAEDVATERDRWLSADEYARLVEAGGGPELIAELESPFRSPAAPMGEFATAWAQVQTATARMWKAAEAVQQAAGAGAEFVGDDLALVMNTHPLTGRGLLAIASGACAVPELMALVESADLSDKHALALLVEAGRWAPGDGALQAELVRVTLERCAARVARGEGWPTPGELKRRLVTVAFLRGLTAAEKRKKTVAERRGVAIFPTGVEAASLSIEGPQVMVAQMMDAIRARAQALHALPGNTRTREQCEFDAARDLLCIDADGGSSRVPALDVDGNPVTLTVRGVEISLVMPYSTATGGDLELAEIPGLGPVLPSTARELLAQASRVRRIAVDADTGHVIAVDDAVPVPAEPVPAQPLATDPAAPSPTQPDPADAKAAEAAQGSLDVQVDDGAEVPERVRVLLDRLVDEPVGTRDLSSASYRVPRRLRRFVEHRDRTCVFPGCTVPGRFCDVDHREPWPHGPTSPENCHCLCRRHHRAKQGYFTVAVDPETGDTIWTTPDGRQYRRPPPTF